MPKHWGIQFQQRVEQFTKMYVASRLHQWEQEWKVEHAKTELRGCEKWLIKACAETAWLEDAIGILMEIGPQGLMKLEAETKLDGYSPGQLVNAHKNGVKY